MDNIKQQLTTPPKKPSPSKSEQVQHMLGRRAGATLAEMGTATNWQPHSCRAFLTGLRKKGSVILKEARADGLTCYRLER